MNTADFAWMAATGLCTWQQCKKAECARVCVFFPPTSKMYLHLPKVLHVVQKDEIARWLGLIIAVHESIGKKGLLTNPHFCPGPLISHSFLCEIFLIKDCVCLLFSLFNLLVKLKRPWIHCSLTEFLPPEQQMQLVKESKCFVEQDGEIS